MKVALCALIVLVTLSCPAEMTTIKLHMFRHMLSYLKPLITKVKNNDMHVHSPTSDIQECCSKAALECFSSQLLQLNVSAHKDLQTKLYRNLHKTITVNNVDTCTEEQRKNVECMSCGTYPKVSSKEFLLNLETLLQKAINRLA